MSETNEPLLSSDELSAIQEMVDSGEFEQEPFNIDLDSPAHSVARNEGYQL